MGGIPIHHQLSSPRDGVDLQIRFVCQCQSAKFGAEDFLRVLSGDGHVSCGMFGRRLVERESKEPLGPDQT